MIGVNPIRTAVMAVAATVAALLVVAPARADFGIAGFDAKVTQADGALETQAGAHPDGTTDIALNLTTNPRGNEIVDGTIKDLRIDLPAGLVGDPTAMPRCAPSQFAASACSPLSQVGVISVTTRIYAGPFQFYTLVPIFNLVPAGGHTAQFGFKLSLNNVLINASVRSDGDYGISTVTKDIPNGLLMEGAKIVLWGVPADPSHDYLRPPLGGQVNCAGGDIADPAGCTGGGASANVEPKAFWRTPTLCSGPLTTTLSARSWQEPGKWVSATATSPAVTGCDRLPFTPSMSAGVDSAKRDSPTGLSIDLGFPQEGLSVPGTLAPADLKRTAVALPPGLAINPASADGLQACGDTQLALRTLEPVSCPEASKIGSVEATTPLLSERLSGAVYLRPQNSNDPASGEMFRLALVLRSDERGLLIKLPGSAKADPVTGRVEATFDESPQLPVSDISVKLKSGSRAPLATPKACGAYTTAAELNSWSGKTVELNSSFTIAQGANGGPCSPPGFTPGFEAGAENPVGGAFSSFVARVARADGDEDIRDLTVQLPPGLLAELKGVPQCPEAQAAEGSCSNASRIGSATVGAGAGSTPFYLKGQPVYLTGPYKGAPFGLAVVARAIAGPFDLGTVVVRQRVVVDPLDAHVTVVSDPLPTILGGVPLRLRTVNVDVDRPQFMMNPTSCAPQAVSGTLASVAGQGAVVSSRFQVGDCGSLALKPSLGLTLSGKGQTVDGKHPAVTANLVQPFGAQANLKKVRVALPLSLALDPDNANGLCEFVDGSKVEPTCPKASIVGSATAVTPILDEPLSGPVYFVKNIRKDAKSGREIRTLPKLVIPLVGQNGLRLTLTGTSDVVDDQLVTTFDNIPDAPVSSFKLNIIGGKGGILTVSGADICKATQVADQQIDGQNGKQADADVYIQTPSCPLKIISKKVGKTSVAVKIGGLGAGKVTVTGKGIKKTTKMIAKSTVATISAKRSKGRPGKVTVSFDPTGPAKAHKTTK